MRDIGVCALILFILNIHGCLVFHQNNDPPSLYDGNNDGTGMAAAKHRRKSTGGLGQQIRAGAGITKHNSNKPITPSMLKKALNELPEGLIKYPKHLRKKVGVVENKN